MVRAGTKTFFWRYNSTSSPQGDPKINPNPNPNLIQNLKLDSDIRFGFYRRIGGRVEGSFFHRQGFQWEKIRKTNGCCERTSIESRFCNEVWPNSSPRFTFMTRVYGIYPSFFWPIIFRDRKSPAQLVQMTPVTIDKSEHTTIGGRLRSATEQFTQKFQLTRPVFSWC